MGSVKITLEQLASDILRLAGDGGMPETFFYTDPRIGRACEVLGLTPTEACNWTYRQTEIAKMFREESE
jgi:hypothetical protein